MIELPSNLDAERAVLGGIILRGRTAFQAASEHVSEVDFYHPSHQALFAAMSAIDDAGRVIDVITVESQLRAHGTTELVGGISQIASLDRYASPRNIEEHAKIVRDASRMRSLVQFGRELIDEALARPADVATFAAGLEERLRSITDGTSARDYRSSKDLMIEVFEGIKARQHRTDSITGVPTGFRSIDEMTAGLQPTDLIILAARPSMGKTALALNIAQNSSVMQARFMSSSPDDRPRRVPILIFSLEMAARQLIERMLCSDAGVDFSALRGGGRMMEQDFRDLIAAAGRISEAKLFVDDQPSLPITDIRARARRWRADPNVFDQDNEGEQLGAIMVDYLQLARGGKARYDSREQEISEISRGLKAMAKELKLPVIALSQLNRAVDSRADHRPMLSDLRESGAIEQDADVIMFIYRAERYLSPDASEEQLSEVRGKAEVIIGKQRNGPVGTVHLNFVQRHTKFTETAT